MKVRAKDIAQKLGVSPATVSNALNGREGVGEQLRDRILKAAQQMGYETGKGTTDRKSFIRMLIVKTATNIIVDNQFFSEMYEIIQSECHEAGLEMMMNHINMNGDSSWKSMVAKFCEESCAGIILLATEMNSKELQYFAQCKSPLVVLDNLCRNEPFHSVVMNNFQAGYQATKELYENGHRRIAHLACKREFSNSYFRRNGYETAMQELGLESETDVWDVDISIEGAYQSVKAMLESGRRLPTAFFACNDTIAVGAIRAIQEKGFRVPEDVSIIGMDDTDICLACNPQLTTFHVHRREIGRIAVRQLLTPPAAEKGVYVKTEVSVSLVRRGSVRKIDGMIL